MTNCSSAGYRGKSGDLQGNWNQVRIKLNGYSKYRAVFWFLQALFYLYDHFLMATFAVIFFYLRPFLYFRIKSL